MEKLKNLPALRFPEFNGGWGKLNLGEIAVKKSIKNSKNEVINVFTNSASRGIVNQRDYFDKDIANQNNLLNYYVVDNNDFIYNPRISNHAPVGPISRNHLQTGVMSPLYSVFKIMEGNLDFFEIYFSTTKWHEYMGSIANYGARSDRMNITTNDFYLMPLPFPALAEQQKIASFFTAIDTKLTQLKQKKSLLEQYKKGVMRKIFAQEIRFKDEDGKEYPKWEKKKLGSVCKIYDGTHQTPEYKEVGVPFYSVEHVTSNNFSVTKLISQEVFESENKKVKLEKGDILMTKIGDIGTPKLINWDVNASFYVSLALIKQTNNNSNEFICHFIKSIFFQMELHKRTIHVAFPRKINLGEIGECLLMLPSLAEQIQIANLLTALDEKINHCQLQIERTALYKKGLLQKMFC